MNPKFKIILFYLCMENGPLTAHELFELMIKEDREVFSNVNDISISLNKLREQKKWVSNGEPKQVGKKTLLTWEITQAGQKALENDEQGLEEIINHVDPSENTSIQTDPMEREEIIEIEDPLAFYDSACDSIRAMLETLLNQKNQAIAHKFLKITTLGRLKLLVEPLNQDVAKVLDDIVNDLNKLEEVAHE